MKRLVYLMIILLGMGGILVTGLVLLYQNRARELDVSVDSVSSYDRHYLFVSTDQSQMLRDIYDQTAASCEASGVYLEWCGKDMPGEYTAADCVDISVAMKADGIIVFPDSSADLNDAITRAYDAGIPVVTILRDLPSSGRVSYIGVSNYQMGDLYGGHLLSLLHNGNGF